MRCVVRCTVQWSFLYAEYKPNACFWEFIIMGRKLAFLAATILLPMALDTPEETTAQMQLLVCVLLAVTFLLLHASLHPFKRGVLNRLERLGLTAIALRCVHCWWLCAGHVGHVCMPSGPLGHVCMLCGLVEPWHALGAG